MLQVAGWIEAFPTSRETADTVAYILVENITLQFGLPTTIQSDNGPAFTAQIVQQVATSLNITWNLHIPYHPQSSGKVERAHGILKSQLTKLSIETRLSFPWHSPESGQPHETPLDSAPLSWFTVGHS
ncbi:igE-binding protein-like isoform X1 [Saccopteryx bilineata]|uniref:igE-binding protein-like isoform X1 n=1 Tax=Saccopteryx bilineata TaxID=59482 RepID=UPI00338EAEBC